MLVCQVGTGGPILHITPEQELCRQAGISTLSCADVEAIHDALVTHFEESGDPMTPAGVRDRGLLESAVGRQIVGSGNVLKYRDARANAATLLYGLCMNHPFHNGNKRTALVACLAHLDGNRYIPDNVLHSEFYNLVLALADHKLSSLSLLAKETKRLSKQDTSKKPNSKSDVEVHLLTKWLELTTRIIDKRERPLTIRTLRQILTRLGCQFGEPHQNFVDIYGPEKLVRTKILSIIPRTKVKRDRTQISYPGEGSVVSVNTIKMIRREFNLTPDDGIDSRVFYDKQAVVDAILNDYQGILRRLARV